MTRAALASGYSGKAKDAGVKGDEDGNDDTNHNQNSSFRQHNF
jgi:hypothetical protein